MFEWRSGKKEAHDFTTGAYIDVYDGNVNTLKNMRHHHPNKYNTMMADIYDKVRCVLVRFIFDISQYLLAFIQLDGWQRHSYRNCQHPHRGTQWMSCYHCHIGFQQTKQVIPLAFSSTCQVQP